MDDQAVLDALKNIPLELRRYFTPGTALALAHFTLGSDLQTSFKVAAAAGRKRCRCCLLRSKPRCCIGRSQIERAAHHGCKFCTHWVLMGYGSSRPLAKALDLAEDVEIRCMLQNHNSQSSTVVPSECLKDSPGDIPRVVHQIWIGPEPPPFRWIDTWRVCHTAAHPSWDHRLWRDEDIISILPAELRTIYDRLERWCLKADIARYVILEEYGGVYVDADMIWLESEGLNSVIEGRCCVLAFESSPSKGFGMDERIGNAIIGATPHHQLISRILNDMVNDFAGLESFLGKESPFLQQYKVGYRLTSPVALTRAFLDLHMDVESLVPTDVFYPVPWWRGQSLSYNTEQTRVDFPSAICTHYGYSTNQLDNSRQEVECVAVENADEKNANSRICHADHSACSADWLERAMSERQRKLWHSAMEKVRHDRETSRANMVLPCSVEQAVRSTSFSALCVRKTESYNPTSHPLREAFLVSIGCPQLALDKWHHTVTDFAIENPSIVFQHKTTLLEPLKDENARKLFESTYHKFVHQVVAPEIAATMACHGDDLKKLYYAAFPCIRIVPPSSNWTIRPHADFMYGHPIGSINIWVPLTSASDSNTLFAELSPGKENFEPMNLEYGQFCRWYGTMCAHFTLPNISDQTRVSLDFRVVPDGAYRGSESAYTAGSYYAVCEVNADGIWYCSKEGEVSGQHGFPFTVPKMKYY